MILDTTSLVALVRGERSVDEALKGVDERVVATVSPVSVMELWEGIKRTSASDRERRLVESLLADVRTVAFDRPVAIRAGTISAGLAAAGMTVGTADEMIAAMALVHNMPVVTRDVGHFDRIDDLEVVTD